MSNLGFTFFPKDWWTSDSFYTLNPFERYVYLELLFMMYDNSGKISNDRVKVERRLMTTIKEDVWLKITDLMVKDGDQLTHNSVRKRLTKAEAARENGKKGGRPKSKNDDGNNSDLETKKPNLETQDENPKNPPYKEKEKVKEKIKEKETKKEGGEETQISYEEYEN